MDKLILHMRGQTFLEEMNKTSFAKVLNAVLVSAEGGNVTCYCFVSFHLKFIQLPLVVFSYIGIAKDGED